MSQENQFSPVTRAIATSLALLKSFDVSSFNVLSVTVTNHGAGAFTAFQVRGRSSGTGSAHILQTTGFTTPSRHSVLVTSADPVTLGDEATAIIDIDVSTLDVVEIWAASASSSSVDISGGGYSGTDKFAPTTGLGSAALRDVGTTSGTVAAGDTGNVVAGATITVAAQAVRTIKASVQLLASGGGSLAVRGAVDAYLSDDEYGNSIVATAPSSAVAIATNGLLINQVTDKAFKLVSEANGLVEINVINDVADTFYLVLVMPSGALIVSAAITFSAP